MSRYKFDCDAYLQRLKYTGQINPVEKDLKDLHRAHFYTIPFENFDILLGRGVHLEPGKLFNKLVQNRRGGYCFELNGLFLMALRAFGFDARPLLGRVHKTGTPTGRGHQLTLIAIQEKQWIADVGFGGDTPRTPIPLVLGRPVIHDGQKIRLIDTANFGIMVQTFKSDQWENLYSFDLGYVCQADIDYGNHYTSTHPDALFTTARVAALPVQNGVYTLFNNTFKSTIGEEENIQELAQGQPYLDALKTHFGIELDAPYEALLSLG